MFEGADPDGDHNPLTGGSSLNTDGTGANNDSIPNYLNADDDGNNILTRFEGADPDADGDPTLGTLATNTDGDLLPTYLDSDDDDDGVFTFFEGVNPDNDGNPNTGATLNTDHYTGVNTNIIVDEIPNYLDTDDDGDGIYTMYEGADLDGDHNPLAGTTAPLNTNGVAGNNPKMIVNAIPNYLDYDDDGDGYATLEDTEKGTAAPTGNPYTLDSDADSIPNYLDYSDIIYPVTEAIKLNNYVNLVEISVMNYPIIWVMYWW